MPYAEEELATVLRDLSGGASPNPGRVDQVVRRGRAIRRRRRGGGLAAGTMAVAAVAALTLSPGTGNRPVDDAVPVAVRLPLRVAAPEATRRSEALSLVQSVRRQRMGEMAALRFTARSANTLFNVRCAVPNSWLITRLDTPGRPGSVGRCGPDDNVSQLDKRSAGPGWVGSVRTLEVWVLPPQAPVTTETSPASVALIASETGLWDGAWAVGIYDRTT
ncbi:hypothetical protein [Actinomadura sp. NEAU-AAG7]|uniref:hypothetical protein n=1 Tax=Actinomadura sp. NEAU-AAG7 TaxID=2839640 RepID=UPI001BE48142|nr:hypothetical protein [Actinomadura sp. NEAU-AAG7]MBT2207295.1 hypothetical protein [Actinomadura sp. NEAU-AAG7]